MVQVKSHKPDILLHERFDSHLFILSEFLSNSVENDFLLLLIQDFSFDRSEKGAGIS